MVSSVTFGPTEQFSPKASTGHDSSRPVKIVVCGSVQHVAEVVDGDVRDDGHVRARRFARRGDSFPQFIDVVEGLEQQQVHAGLEQRLDLLAKDGARLGERWSGPAARSARPTGLPLLPRTPGSRAASRAMRTPARLISRSLSAKP